MILVRTQNDKDTVLNKMKVTTLCSGSTKASTLISRSRGPRLFRGVAEMFLHLCRYITIFSKFHLPSGFHASSVPKEVQIIPLSQKLSDPDQELLRSVPGCFRNVSSFMLIYYHFLKVSHTQWFSRWLGARRRANHTAVQSMEACNQLPPV